MNASFEPFASGQHLRSLRQRQPRAPRDRARRHRRRRARRAHRLEGVRVSLQTGRCARRPCLDHAVPLSARLADVVCRARRLPESALDLAADLGAARRQSHGGCSVGARSRFPSVHRATSGRASTAISSLRSARKVGGAASWWANTCGRFRATIPIFAHCSNGAAGCVDLAPPRPSAHRCARLSRNNRALA